MSWSGAPRVGFVAIGLLMITASCTNEHADEAVAFFMRFKHLCVSSDPHNILSNWTSDSPTPCSWHGVSCSGAGLVTALNLTGAGLIGTLQLSTLTSLPSLRHLLLRGNSFTVGNFTVSSSCNLETLDLSANNFSGKFPFTGILPCHHLTYLNLSRNFITGATDTGFRIGVSLLQLDMSRNRVSEPTLLSHTLQNCYSLVLLNFSDNGIIGQLSETLDRCKNLSTLDLSHNLLSGGIPPRFVGDSLKHLDLSNNNFSGVFSEFDFGHCMSLVSLSFSHNALSGTEFPPSLSNCQVLETLDLSHNELRSKIPGVLLGGLKSLRELFLGDNQFSGGIPGELGMACGSLVVLDLSKNKLSGGLPFNFGKCTSLQSVNLAKNYLYGDFLASVVSNLSSLRYLYVSLNNITGPVPSSLANCTQLQVLDLSSNAFTGNIPSSFCSSHSPSALENIYLADNYLSGMVPAELGGCRNLRKIVFSFNNLNGPIPLEIWSLPNLSDLLMWANNLTGEIPEGICVNGGNLETLILNNNFISGPIPQSIGNCTNMTWMSLTSNHITGEIPDGVGNLNELAILELGNNLLTGRIPPELGKCRSLIWLDLSSNKLSGTIPIELANQAGLIIPGSVAGKQFAFVRNMGGTSCRSVGQIVEYQGIRAERLEGYPMVHSCPLTRTYFGWTVYTFANNGSMIYLDLSYNSLSGSIPENLGALAYLQVFNLGHNRLSGKIPDRFGDLKAITVLYLSNNNLQGFIPGSLGKLSLLTDIDVSNNNLTGSIPSGGQLTTFLPSRYENNSDLCGIPLPLCGTWNHSPGFQTPEKKQSSAAGLISLGFYVSMAIGFIIGFWGVVLPLAMKDSWRHSYFRLLSIIGDWVYVRAALLKARIT